jgi:hypothetical protein
MAMGMASRGNVNRSSRIQRLRTSVTTEYAPMNRALRNAYHAAIGTAHSDHGNGLPGAPS